MHLPDVILQTDRLILRPWSQDDFEPLAQYYTREDNARFVGGVSDADRSWRARCLALPRASRLRSPAMPFTITHTIAVLPVARAVPLSALLIGSMIPDLPLYVDLGVSYTTTHTFAGLLTACLPLGLIVWAVFHVLIKQSVLALMPQCLRSRLEPLSRQHQPVTLRVILLVAIALLLGALTHIVWDAFTHADRWGVTVVAALGRTHHVAGISLPGYAIFQHGSSIIGLPALVFLTYRRFVRQPRCEVAPAMRGALRVPIILAIAGLPLLAGALAVSRQRTQVLEFMLFRFVTVAGAVFMLALLLWGVAYSAATWQAGRLRSG